MLMYSRIDRSYIDVTEENLAAVVGKLMERKEKHSYCENIWIVPTVHNSLKVHFVCFLLFNSSSSE